jgi:hypothetical protein
MNDPARERLIEVLGDLAHVKQWVGQLVEAWNAVWSEQGTPEDVAYVGFVIDQLAERFGLNHEGKTDENADESPDDARRDDATERPAHGREENGESQEG